MNDNIIRYYSATQADGEMLFGARLRDTVVCASYVEDPANPLNLRGVAQLLTKQLVKAHILESINDYPSEALYQACLHVADAVTPPAKIKWNGMRGKFSDVSEFADAVKRRTNK